MSAGPATRPAADRRPAAERPGGGATSPDALLDSLVEVTVPDGAPPFDDDPGGERAWRRWAERVSAPEPGHTGRAGPLASGAGHDLVSGPGAAWLGQFTRAVVEVLAGLRPWRQLTTWTSGQAREQLRNLSLVRHARSGAGQGTRVIRTVSSQPAEDVAEVTVIAAFGGRTRAVALRFQRAPARPATAGLPARPARWLCTDVETA